jgi:hypothetical protein
MLAVNVPNHFGHEAKPLEVKKNEFNPYQDNGGYESCFYLDIISGQPLQ